MFPLAFTAAAAAKSLQSCPTLCNPIDGSPPVSPIPGILQARTLEWEERDKKCLTLAAFFLCLETPGIPACYPLSWKKIYDQLGQHIKKQRHYFTDKGPSNQSYAFSSSHVWMEKAMEPHSSTLAWKIPWMEEPGRLQSMGSLRVGHD